jgi:hypothetical protein
MTIMVHDTKTGPQQGLRYEDHPRTVRPRSMRLQERCLRNLASGSRSSNGRG